MKRPWMPLYVSDFINSEAVIDMPPEACGVYIKLLCFNWEAGDLPADPDRLAKMVRMNPRSFRRLWPIIQHLFPVISPGRLGNDRVMKELKDADEKAEKSSKAANKRHHGHADALPTDHSTAQHSTADIKDLSAGADLFGNPVPKPKEAKPKPEPLPFKVDDAIKAIADGSGGRFVASPLDTGKSIFVTKLIRKYPDIETWRGVGRWIANGGDGWKLAIDIRSIGDFETWVSHSQKTTGKHYTNYSDPRPPVAETKEVKL